MATGLLEPDAQTIAARIRERAGLPAVERHDA
jgi:hypothetical protein